MKKMVDENKKPGRPRCFCTEEALDKALGVFLEFGYEGASLDDLTSALGINRPSLYSAFGNKEQLFIAVLRRYHGIYTERFLGLIEKKLPPREMIEVWLGWFLDNFTGKNTSSGCLIVNSSLLAGSSYPKISEELKSFHDLNEELLADYLQGEKKKGNFEGDPRSTSQFYNAVVQGMAVLRRSQGNGKALENIARSALRAWPD